LSGNQRVVLIREYGDSNPKLLVNENEEEVFVVDFETGNIPDEDIDFDDEIILEMASIPQTIDPQSNVQQRLLNGVLSQNPGPGLLPLVGATYRKKESYNNKEKIYISII
jgi:hypothetical protein